MRILCLFTLFFSCSVFAAKPLPPLLREDPPIMPLSEVRQGMTGKGYTVFASSRGPEPFEFEILGIMRGYLGPGEDLIIARLIGEQIERTGVISGMSGSPAYIKGKLIGAVGYRFGAFTKEPIAGIMPIERMLTAKDAPSGKPWKGKSAARFGAPEALAVPIAVSGLSQRVADAFADQLSARGLGPLIPTAGAAAGGGDKKMTRFFPSGPIAGMLVDGDVKMAGIGTVTWVKGDRFLAFGHPFLGIGESQMPVRDAQIVLTVASDAGSYKMGQATTRVGRLTDDRLPAIGGTMGVWPDTVALTINLDMAGPRRKADAKKKLRLSVMQHPSDTPLFVAMGVASALSSRAGAELGGTLHVGAKIKLNNGERVSIERRFSAENAPLDLAVAFGLLNELATLTQQSFAEVRIDSIHLDIKRETEVRLAKIRAVDVIDGFRAGETSRVRVRLSRYKGVDAEKVLPVRLPKALKPGSYTLWVADKRKATSLESAGGLVGTPKSFGTHLAQFRAKPRDGVLHLYLIAKEAGTNAEGKTLPRLPNSLAGILNQGSGWSASAAGNHTVALGRIQTELVTSGAASAEIRVEGRRYEK